MEPAALQAVARPRTYIDLNAWPELNPDDSTAPAAWSDQKEINALLAEASSQGVILWVTDDQLRYRAPEGAMTATLRSELAAWKREIVAALRDASPPPAVPASQPQFYRRPAPERMPIAFYHQTRWENARSGAMGVIFTNGLQVIRHIEGPFNIPALQKSVRYLLKRHRVLTARVAPAEHGAELVFDQESNIALQVIDLSDTPAETRISQARHIAHELVWTPFSMDAAAPLFRIFVIRLSEHEHILGYVIHHFICDGWSVLVFTNELTRAYAAFSAGTQPELPELPIEYSDFVAGMNEWIQGGGAQESAAYWRNHLRGAPPTRVPPDNLLPPETPGDTVVSWTRVSPEVVAQAQGLSKSRRIWMQTIVVAAIAAALAHCSDSRDLVIVSRTHGRHDALLVGLVGAFFDAMALRISISMQMSFDALADQIQQTLTQSSAHEAYPYQLVKNALPQVGASDINIMVNFYDVTNSPTGDRVQLPGSKPLDLDPPPRVVRPVRMAPGFYTLAAIGPEGMDLITEYTSVAYRAETVARYGEAVSRLLQRAVQDSTRTLSSMLMD